MFSSVAGWVLNKLLGRVNGMKTYLGIAGIVLTFVLGQLIPWLTASWPSLGAHLAPALPGLQHFFDVLVALGFAHKLDKAAAGDPSPITAAKITS